MRLVVFPMLCVTFIVGCSFNYSWINNEKTGEAQAFDKSECLNLASIVIGTNQDLLNFASTPALEPKRDVYFDCLIQKGYRKKYKPL